MNKASHFHTWNANIHVHFL